MDSVKFFLSTSRQYYSFKNASNIEMAILGRFFVADVSFCPLFYKNYALNTEQQYTNGNITALEKQNNYIFLNDQYSEEKIPTKLKITHDQFIKLLDDWEEKVCKLEPKEVIINHENDQFIIETKN